MARRRLEVEILGNAAGLAKALGSSVKGLRDLDRVAASSFKGLIGSPGAVREARGNIADIRLDQQRMLLESATITPASRSVQPQTGTPIGGGFSITIPGGLHLHGIQNVQQLLRELQRLQNTGGVARRGRHAGTGLGVG